MHRECQESVAIVNSDSEVESGEDNWIWAENAEEEYDKRNDIR
jgi:hypothetical protein